MGQLGYLFNLVFTFPIFNALVLFYRLFGDLGLSIVVLTIVIKLILFPLTLQQLKSMKATQALQPQVAEIKKKYAKDQQAQMMATQALYKEYGVNPAAGCLPLVPQLFVLYGLYQAFDIVLRFTPSKTETLLQHINNFIYPFIAKFATLPNLNLTWFTFINHTWFFPLGQPDPTHILPVLAGLATFVQLRMSQPARSTTTASKDDPTAQTMKTMQYIMPLFTVFIGWTFPSGLALYWTVSSIFQAIQQYFVTGWGNLLIRPNLASSNGSVPTSQRDFVKEKQEGAGIKLFGRTFQMPTTATEPDNGVVEGSITPAKNNGNGDGPVGSKLRAVPAPATNGNGMNGSNGASAARRRASGGTASARRRNSGSGSSSQKRSSSKR